METKVLEIIQFTDPVCSWCWGSEPVLRTLETRFSSQLKISYVMGGLVKDITSFYDRYNDIGGDPERSNKNIAKHWVDASNRHRMPVKVKGLKLFSKEQPSTYPQNIAYKAAQMQDEVKANRFLRRIREASAAEAKQTNITDVLVELASETKTYIDTICIAGKTFRYSPTGVQGLLENKKCLHIHSSGGFHSKDPQSHADGYLKDIMSFWGVYDYKSIVAEGHQAVPDKAPEIISSAIAKFPEIIHWLS